jgi:ATP synthase protein I
MRQNKHFFKAMALTSVILSQLAGSTLIGIFAGRWIDRTFETEPFFLILCLFIGLAAGVYAMIRFVQHFNSGE